MWRPRDLVGLEPLCLGTEQAAGVQRCGAAGVFLPRESRLRRQEHGPGSQTDEQA